MKNLKKFLNTFRPKLEETIRRTLQELANSAQTQTEKNIIAKISHFIFDGKMLRGHFVLLGFLMHSKKTPSKKTLNDLMKMAAAVEFNHMGLLIQDDIMDRDKRRRGKDALHVLFQREAQRRTHQEMSHYGQSASVIVSDICLYLSSFLLAGTSFSSETKSQIFAAYFEDLYATCIGQAIDLEASELNREPRLKDIHLMHKWKTGRYTFALPFKLGAIAGGSKMSAIEKFNLFGETLGLVFQLKDDELSLYGDPKLTGKTAGADIMENKRTILRYELLRSSMGTDLDRVKKMLGNRSLTARDIQYLRRHAVSLGIVEDIHADMKRLSQQAVKHINRMKVSQSYTTILQELVEYNLTREK